MKKILLGIVAAAGMLFAASCTKETATTTPAGDEVLVTFSVGVDEVLPTRTISDGTSVDQLFYQAFNKEGEPVGEQETMEVDKWPATPSLTLVTGKEYTVLFWAQSSQTKAYDAEDLRAVKVNYKNAVNNDENRDAFCKAEPVTVTEGMSAISVELRRPFAQVNLGVKELGRLGGITQSQMVVGAKSIYSEIDLLNGTVSGEPNTVPVTFAYAAVPDEKLTAGDQDEYIWLSMSYLLVKNETNIDFAFSFQNRAGTLDEDPIKIDNAPVKTNHRTNLLGSTATQDVDFEVEIKPGYDGSENVEDEPLPETDVTVSEVKVEIKEGTVTFSASFEGDKNEIKSAYFVCTPDGQAVTRAGEDGVVKVEATIEDGTLTAEGSVEELELVAGTKYVVTVEINGETAEVSGETETPSFAVPEEPDPDAPKDLSGTYALLLAKDNAYVMISSVSSQSNSLGFTEITYTGAPIEDVANDMIWVVEKQEDGSYTFQNGTKYMDCASDSNVASMSETKTFMIIEDNEDGSLYIHPKKYSSRYLSRQGNYVRFYGKNSSYYQTAYLVEISDKPTIIVEKAALTIPAEGENDKVTVTVKNSAKVDVDIQYNNGSGWIDAKWQDDVLTYVIDENTETVDRSATITIKASNDSGEKVKTIAVSQAAKGSIVVEPIELTFSFTSQPNGWPTSVELAEGGSYKHTPTDGSISYDFTVTTNVYCNSNYLMLASKTEKGAVSISLPKIEGYKLTAVNVTPSSTASANAELAITAEAGSTTAVAGGETKKATNSSFEFTLENTVANTVYYLTSTNSGYNAQVTQFVLKYEAVN